MSKKIERLLILTSDFIAINLAWVVFFYFRVESGWFDLLSRPDFLLPMITVYFYWLIIFTFVGMYRTWFAHSRFDELATLFKASFVGIFILFFLILYDDYTHGASTSIRFFILLYWAIFFIFVSSGRLIIRSLQRNLLIRGIGRRKVLIIGFNPQAHEVHKSIKNHKALGLDVIGYVAVRRENVGKDFLSVPVIDTVKNLESVIEKTQIKTVIIALERKHEDILLDIISKSEGKGIELKIVPDLYDIISGQARTSQIYGFPLIDVMPELMPEWEKKIKRLMDIFLSLAVLLITLPITLITAVAIKIDSKGPILYAQERMGQGGKIFKIYKFRSMIKDAEKLTGPVWSSKDDPRITKVGRFIRKFRIDEIPQMFNILKGDMSFVGPRPERPFFVEKLSKEIPYYKRRLKVRPGITGWAQVKHKYDETIDDVKEKLKYDFFYIENMSLKMDFIIILRTVLVVLFGKGHYE
ncbi:sugar transferase [Melioribacteraceae bacterium 4301-Me]|uniref:sugar transferase n=1 Tax=Pyranulibacter aquaticus TaxID=3163344 RepID=UPI003597E342